MTECVICFDDVVGGGLRCKNRSCQAVMCQTCVGQYVTICQTDNVIPKCPNRACGWFYLLSDFFGPLAAQSGAYAQCCFNALLLEHGDTARKQVEIHNSIAQLKSQRLRFVTESFPAGIAYMARMVMPEKLRRIDKQVKDRLADQTRQSRRVCMNLTCGGSLNDNLQCLSCTTIFCRECEKVRGENHTCDPNDVATIRALTEMVHCPGCHLPVERSQGCDHMKCARCGQNFLYSTGAAGGWGNHNNAAVETPTQTLVSVIHRDILLELGLLDTVNSIETMVPRTTDDRSLSTVLMEHYRNDGASSSQFELEVARAFERHICRMYLNKRYHQAIQEVERHIIGRTVTRAYLHTILDLLRQPL